MELDNSNCRKRKTFLKEERERESEEKGERYNQQNSRRLSVGQNEQTASERVCLVVPVPLLHRTPNTCWSRSSPLQRTDRSRQLLSDYHRQCKRKRNLEKGALAEEKGEHCFSNTVSVSASVNLSLSLSQSPSPSVLFSSVQLSSARVSTVRDS